LKKFQIKNQKIPNEETLQAISESRAMMAARRTRFNTADKLFNSLEETAGKAKNLTSIDLCIATYQRASMLENLLDSLSHQVLTPSLTIAKIIIVDNDPAHSGRPTVEAAQTRGLPVHYLTQPQKNIALTRNMAVAHATAPLIAFIDDDEIATPDWLSSLYTALREHNADIVIGPVQGKLPHEAPNWVRQGGFFDAPQQSTGSTMLRGATNNALLKRSLIPDPKNAFNPRYGLTGGEDTDFFERLKTRGAKMIWCQEALVLETVPPDRTTVKWLLRRDFRGGQTFADILGRPKAFAPRLKWFIYRLTLAIGALFCTLSTWPFSRVLGMRCAKKSASNWGQLSTVFSKRYVEYRENS
jgi:succinoglycan biosynthesis protein ExoM